MVVTHRRGQKKNLLISKQALIRCKIVKRLVKESSHQKVRKGSTSSKPKSLLFQRPRMSITLKEYMPNEFYDLVYTSAMCCQTGREEDPFDDKNKEEEKANPQKFYHNICMIEIVFSDNDLLLRTKLHNCPLFVKGYSHQKMVNRILVDDGFAINILPFRTMKELGITTDELSPSCLMI